MRLTGDPSLQVVAEAGPIPLVIGVTGHRDLLPEDHEPLKSGLASALAELRRRYPHTPVMVLTGLAEGADQLAAEVGLQSGAAHIAVLPRPPEAFLDDFPAAEARRQFEHLLGRSASCVVAQPDPLAKGYAEQGEWLAVCSHILLAIWDGRDGAGASGTADVVRLCLGGFKNPCASIHRPLDPLETRPVWWARARRLRNPQPPVDFAIKPLYPGAAESAEHVKKVYEKLLQDTERFNRSAAQSRSWMTPAEAQSMEALLPEPVRKQLSPPLQEMIQRYACADVLAIHYQKLFRHFMDAMLVSVFLAGAILQVRSWPGLAERIGDGLYATMQWLPVILFIVAAGFYYGERRAKLHTRYLDFRALAEGLRVQIFWSIAGLKASVADEYLARYRGEIEWIRRAIRAVALRLGSNHLASPDAASILVKHWLEAQNRFFTRSAERQERLPRYTGFAWNFAIIGGLILAVLKMLPGGGGLGPSRVVIVASLIVFGLGLVKLRIKILALTEQVRQYHRIADSFRRGEAKLTEGADPATIYLELGREALTENADWLLLHRERPLELPKT